MIFILAMGVIAILSALVLVFAQSMRTEALAAGNRVAAAQADAVEQGAEQFVLASVDANTTDAMTIMNIGAEGMSVGSGYFWLIRPDYPDDTTQDYGIQDESAKLNINYATGDQLTALPGMTSDVADNILAWVGSSDPGAASGVSTSYYESLPDPYQLKDGACETVEELLLVKDVTPDLLFGSDANRNYLLDSWEQQGTSGMSSAFSSAEADPRGLFNFITVFTKPGASSQANSKGKAVSTSGARVNINTAPEQVLEALGMTQSQADTIISSRGTSGLTDTSSVDSSLTQYVSVISNQYSADIVAISGDGRGFKREYIVVDCTQSPCSIVYRRDLTSYGWPLPEEIRDSLRAGKGVPADYINTTGSSTSGLPGGSSVP